jgi:hypothetical protein
MENLFPSEHARLFDEARERLRLTSDYALAQRLEWPQTLLSQYKRGRASMGTEAVLHFHERTGIDLKRILVAVVSDKRSRSVDQTSGKAA